MRQTQKGHDPRVEVLDDLGGLGQDPGLAGHAPAAPDLGEDLGVEAHAVLATAQEDHVALVKVLGLPGAPHLQGDTGEAEAVLRLTREP